jgi:hypothetical protein
MSPLLTVAMVMVESAREAAVPANSRMAAETVAFRPPRSR